MKYVSETYAYTGYHKHGFSFDHETTADALDGDFDTKGHRLWWARMTEVEWLRWGNKSQWGLCPDGICGGPAVPHSSTWGPDATLDFQTATAEGEYVDSDESNGTVRHMLVIPFDDCEAFYISSVHSIASRGQQTSEPDPLDENNVYIVGEHFIADDPTGYDERGGTWFPLNMDSHGESCVGLDLLRGQEGLKWLAIQNSNETDVLESVSKLVTAHGVTVLDDTVPTAWELDTQVTIFDPYLYYKMQTILSYWAGDMRYWKRPNAEETLDTGYDINSPTYWQGKEIRFLGWG